MDKDTLLTPTFYAIVGPLLMALVIFGKDWLTNRSLRLSLETIRLAGELAAKQAELAARKAEEAASALVAQKETDRLQAEELKKIAALSVQTHEIVNSQRTQMREDMAAQKAELDKVIAGLRADLRLAQVQASPPPSVLPLEAAQVTIPAVTVAVEAAEPSRIVTP